MENMKSCKRLLAVVFFCSTAVAGSAHAIQYYNLTHQTPSSSGGFGSPNPVDGTYPYDPPLPSGTFDAVINTGIFTTNIADYATYNQIVGTGVMQPFIRIQPNGNVNNCGDPCTEAGYNTDGGNTPNPGPGHEDKAQFEGKDKEGTNWNHALKLGDIGTFTDANGNVFREFILDINESLGDPKGTPENQEQYLSLDKFKLFMGQSGDYDSMDITGTTADDYRLYKSDANGAPEATKIFDIDSGAAGGGGDSSIGLNYALQAGSGNGIDLVVRIPDTLFNAQNGEYVYLYSSFGEVGKNKSNDPACTPSNGNKLNTCTPDLPSGDFSQSAGFEEWSTRSHHTPIVPTLALLVVGFVAMRSVGRVQFTSRMAR
ncbi:MAG: hypothetical protein GEV05_21575 [Betaproteobacteria bacterium]|nr:hypothetical protein [Betaproteobacteria bacterium]